MKRLKRGEYDLVNISLIGHDPITGRSYEECSAEWRKDLADVEERQKKLRWWNVIGQIRCRIDLVNLAIRQGMM